VRYAHFAAARCLAVEIHGRITIRNRKLSDQLGHWISDAEASRYRICQDCDIDQGAMSRFMASKVGMNLETIERLADYLGLELTKRPRKGRKGG